MIRTYLKIFILIILFGLGPPSDWQYVVKFCIEGYVKCYVAVATSKKLMKQ